MASTTKDFVEIEDIRDSIVVLRGGALRSVLEVTALNFDLKSQDEQQGVIQGFQGFLNTIDFPIQIIAQSRKLNILNYLDNVSSMASQNAGELMNVQLREYVQFIKGLSELANIMTKKFYIVVPYYVAPLKTSDLLGPIKKILSRKTSSKEQMSDADFEKNKLQLEERVEVIANAVSGAGVQARVLTQKELLQLYYGYYNFGKTVAI